MENPTNAADNTCTAQEALFAWKVIAARAHHQIQSSAAVFLHQLLTAKRITVVEVADRGEGSVAFRNERGEVDALAAGDIHLLRHLIDQSDLIGWIEEGDWDGDEDCTPFEATLVGSVLHIHVMPGEIAPIAAAAAGDGPLNSIKGHLNTIARGISA